MDDNLAAELIKQLESITINSTNSSSSKIEYRVYFDGDGKIITYTTENLPGNYIIISKEQWAEARHDAIVIDGKLVFTHARRNVIKLERKSDGKNRISRWDINIFEEQDGPHFYYELAVYDIKK